MRLERSDCAHIIDEEVRKKGSTLTLVAVVPTAPTGGITKTPDPVIGSARNG